MLLTSIWQAVCLLVRKNEKRLSNKWNISQLAAKYQTLLFIDSFFFFHRFLLQSWSGFCILCKIYGSPRGWGWDGLINLFVDY